MYTIQLEFIHNLQEETHHSITNNKIRHDNFNDAKIEMSEGAQYPDANQLSSPNSKSQNFL